MLDQDMLNQIAGAQTSDGGNIIRDGRYMFLLKSIKGEKKHSGIFVITEFYVKEATPIEKDVEPNPVGSTCSTVTSLTNPKAKGAGLGNVKKQLLALLGAKEVKASDGASLVEVAEFTQQFAQLMGKLMEASQPARGMQIRCETWRKYKSDDEGNSSFFVNPKWTRVDQTDADVAGYRKFLDSLDLPGAK